MITPGITPWCTPPLWSLYHVIRESMACASRDQGIYLLRHWSRVYHQFICLSVILSHVQQVCPCCNIRVIRVCVCVVGVRQVIGHSDVGRNAGLQVDERWLRSGCRDLVTVGPNNCKWFTVARPWLKLILSSNRYPFISGWPEGAMYPLAWQVFSWQRQSCLDISLWC